MCIDGVKFGVSRHPVNYSGSTLSEFDVVRLQLF